MRRIFIFSLIISCLGFLSPHAVAELLEGTTTSEQTAIHSLQIQNNEIPRDPSIETYEYERSREEDPYLVFYGNYCGIGNKSPDYSKPGIDLLDDLCKIHDFCYETFGHGACNCDMELINNLITYESDLPRTPQAKVIITSMRMLFGKNSCDSPKKVEL